IDYSTTNDQYVAVGTNVTIDKSASKWAGTVVTTDNAVKHGENQSRFQVNGKDKIYVLGAYQVNLDGVTATYDSGKKAVSSGDFVQVNTVLNLTADATKGDTVMQ